MPISKLPQYVSDEIPEASFSRKVVIEDKVHIAVFQFDIYGEKGHIAIRFEKTNQGGLKIYFSTALCGDSDPFDSELGEEIAVGRVMKKTECNTIIQGDMNDSMVISLIKGKLGQVAKFIKQRKRNFEFIEGITESLKRDLRDKFARLK